MIRICKVKTTKEGKTAIEYQRTTGTDWDDFSLKCSDKPRPEFFAALDALREHVIDMCELPEELIERIAVKGVSFSYGGEGETMGATIIAENKLIKSNGAVNINTPHRPSEPYGDTPKGILPDRMFLAPDCVSALKDLEKEARKYIDGDRAQGRLVA